MLSEERTRPCFTEKEAERIAQERYGIRAPANALSAEVDQNFLLEGSNGRRYVLKISNAAATVGLLDFQNRALERLAERGEGLVIPRVVKTLAGEEITRWEEHFVRMLTYIPGTFLVHIEPHAPALLESLGRFFGRMSRALDGFAHPAMHRDFLWDLRHASAVRPLLSHIEGWDRRSLVEHFLNRFDDHALPKLACLRSSVIHNDGNDHNVLVQEEADGTGTVKGIIDFGDMAYTALICELAVASAYAAMHKENPLAAMSLVASGYHGVYPLLEEEVEVLFLLVCARLCTSVGLSAFRRKAVPENEYLVVSEKPAWALLERLVRVDPEAAHEAFRQACGFDPPRVPLKRLSRKDILDLREKHFSKSLSLSYEEPLDIVRGFRQYLYDAEGRAFLDAVNNVPHVGHCHPRVVRAAQRQTGILNTNTRYLHRLIVRYAERLAVTFPKPLQVCFLVNSGSEANDLALRLARAHTGGTDVVVLDGAYHGNLSSLIDVSPYKFDGPGGSGAPTHVHKIPMPDPYRGRYRAGDFEAGKKYAVLVKDALEKAADQNRKPAAFLCESLMGCGGQIVFPKNFLKEAHRYVREAGAIYIADEVQVGFGRVGTHFWAFETQDVVPDIVTLGKPIGNGHPLAAVVTTPEIAASFETGMEYFNTYGGNPVSCSVGMAVLDVIEEEGLRECALRVGARLKGNLERLKDKHHLVGDVRGMGLFIGVELVKDRKTLEPAGDEAARIVERMKEEGILLSIDGPLHNVIKIKPPLVFTEENADLLSRTLDEVLSEEGR